MDSFFLPAQVVALPSSGLRPTTYQSPAQFFSFNFSPLPVFLNSPKYWHHQQSASRKAFHLPKYQQNIRVT